MDILGNITSKFLKGESIIHEGRRIFNLLLNISITSFFYEKFYGEYNWIPFSEYTKMFDFFVKGEFIIPFCIFVIVYSITQFLSWILFAWLTHWGTIKIKKEIIDYELEPEVEQKGIDYLKTVSKYAVKEDVSDEKLTEFYIEFKKEMGDTFYDEMNKEFSKQKKNIADNFYFVVRFVAAITIYHYYLTNFDNILFVIALITLIILGVFLVLSHKSLEILPVIIKKVDERANEKILESKVDNTNM